MRRWLSDRRDAPALLALLLSYGVPVARRRLQEAAGTLTDDLLHAGLVYRDAGDDLVSPFRILPADGLVVVADQPGTGPEAVMPPGPTTGSLLRLLPERMTGAVLDVGTGPGTLALAAARRGATVVATDVSPRAAAFTAFNAALNGLPIDVGVGDLLEPVVGERFDVVLAQPPYVPRPPDLAPVTFMHGGHRGDELALALLGRLQDALAPQGWALVRFDVAEADDHLPSIEEAVGPALDVAVLGAHVGSADALAAAYAAIADPGLGARYADVAARYRQHLAAVGIHALRQLIVFARYGGEVARWRAELDLSRLPERAGDLARYADALDLSVAPEREVMAASVRPTRGSRLVLERDLAGGGASPWVCSVRTDASAPAANSELSELGIRLFECLAVDQRVHRAAAGLGEAYGVGADVVLGAVRHALARGLLVPQPQHGSEKETL